MKIISVRQPWAWAIIHAGKDIENRAWPTKVRGRVLVHAGVYVPDEEDAEDFLDASGLGMIERAALADRAFKSDLLKERIGNVPSMAPVGGFGSNVILLSSIVNQNEADRDLPKLIEVKRAGIFNHIGVSYEPALELVDWDCWLDDFSSGLDHLSWLIVGAESRERGALGRDFHLDWAKAAIRQCRRYQVPIFIKQLGRWPFGLDPSWATAPLRDRAGADPDEWPADLRVREFPPFMRAA